MADEPTNDVVYKHLKTNLPTVVMQSPDLDFPPNLPSYVSKRQLGAYIADYAHTFGVGPLTRFGATVTRVAPAGEQRDEWEVEWTCGGTAHADVFDAVVVANGHYDEVTIPRPQLLISNSSL